MGRWAPYSRREMGRRRREWLRRNTYTVMLSVACALVAGVGTTWVIGILLAGPARWYTLGVLHAGLAAGLLHVLHSSFFASDREALWHLRGAWSEENTRSELRRAKRRGLVWDWVDSISFQVGDLDHVVVTRRGGLIAIDSKWRNEVSSTDATAMAHSAQKVQRRAEALARTLLTKERGSHRARGHSVAVTPVVVLWGAAQRTVPEEALVDGVRFLRGSDLLRWLRTLDGDEVSKAAAKDALKRLRHYRATARQRAGTQRATANRPQRWRSRRTPQASGARAAR